MECLAGRPSNLGGRKCQVIRLRETICSRYGASVVYKEAVCRSGEVHVSRIRRTPTQAGAFAEQVPKESVSALLET